MFDAGEGGAAKRLIGVRTNSGETTGGQDWSCPNRPNTCSVVPGPGGNGPAGTAGTAAGKPDGSVGSPIDKLRGLNLAVRPDFARGATTAMTWANGDRFFVRTGGAQPGEPGGDKPKDGDGEADGDKKKAAKPGDCGAKRCGAEEAMDCFNTAREYNWEYGVLEYNLKDARRDKADWEHFRDNAADRLSRMGLFSQPTPEQVEEARKVFQERADEDQAYIDSLLKQEAQLAAQYDALRKKCYYDCGISLPPSILMDMPPDPNWQDMLKYYSPDQISAVKQMARQQADANQRMAGVYKAIADILGVVAGGKAVGKKIGIGEGAEPGELIFGG